MLDAWQAAPAPPPADAHAARSKRRVDFAAVDVPPPLCPRSPGPAAADAARHEGAPGREHRPQHAGAASHTPPASAPNLLALLGDALYGLAASQARPGPLAAQLAVAAECLRVWATAWNGDALSGALSAPPSLQELREGQRSVSTASIVAARIAGALSGSSPGASTSCVQRFEPLARDGLAVGSVAVQAGSGADELLVRCRFDVLDASPPAGEGGLGKRVGRRRAGKLL